MDFIIELCFVDFEIPSSIVQAWIAVIIINFFND